MPDTLKAAEGSVAKMVGAAFSGESALEHETFEVGAVPTSGTKFEFDEDFQTKIAALSMRDPIFMARASHLLNPSHFENLGEACLVNIATSFFNKYKALPDILTIKTLIKDQVDKKLIRRDELDAVKISAKTLYSVDLTAREYAEEKISEFARHQAVTKAIFDSVDLVGKKDFERIEKEIRKAVDVGINEDGDSYDYFERVTERTKVRIDTAAGLIKPRGVTTGVPKIDSLLYHGGWGRKELAAILAGPKMGKTTALIGFAKGASLKGHNVLYVTLEVSKEILSERLDASIADVRMDLLRSSIHDVDRKVKEMGERSGKLQIHEYPSGTLSPAMLRALVERYKSKGVIFDLVVLDYADLMCPNFRYNDTIENSKSIWVDLRAIASEHNLAMLTATQANREGYKSTVVKAEHAADDFNKIRTADLVISINSTDEERAKGEARLYFAAARNQAGGYTIFIKQAIDKMIFIDKILRVE